MPKRLERSATNRVIGGVCGGIGEYLEIDATLVRIVFIVATVVTAGGFFLAYIAGLVLMPLPDRPAPFVRAAAPPAGDPGATPDATAQDTSAQDTTAHDTGAPIASRPHDPEAEERRRSTVGYLLVALGLVFLLANLGAFRFIRGDLVWPLVLVGLGVLLLAQRIRR